MARLRTEFWVAAYINRLRLAGIPAFVTARGDGESGSVMVRSNTLDGRSRVVQKSYNLLLDRDEWVVAGADADPVIDSMLERQRDRDSDLWIIEVEDKEGRTLLEDGAE